MSDERFNELLAGPFSHPLPMMALVRLALALKHVVDATGQKGDAALEAFCRRLEDRDHATK